MPSGRPHGGAGREPERKINLTGRGDDSEFIPEVPGEHIIDPNALEPPQAGDVARSTGRIYEAPPPESPEMLAALQEMKRSNEELRSFIGELRQQHKDELEDIRMQMELQSAGAPGYPAGPPPTRLPEGVKGDDPVTMQTLVGVLNNMQPSVTALAVRATWDVTPAEEQEAFQTTPNLQYLPEPQRTQKIKQVVSLLRRRRERQNGGRSAAGTAGPTTVTEAPRRTRELSQPVVPHAEAPRPPIPPPGSGEAPEDGAYKQAYRTYLALQAKLDETRDSRERKKILQQMKATHNRINSLLGIDDHQIADTAWRHGAGLHDR